uniref:Reverse transcriptase domain-containing protein n=1 Tax=Astyanax mexicanus TaxID=7994 RepID=A0A8B9HUE3_ASTMX
ILLYLKNPATSVPEIRNLISNYSVLSGYKIIFGKSTAIQLNVPDYINVNTPFHLTNTGFRYLGITISPDLNNLYRSHYSPILETIMKNVLEIHLKYRKGG